VFSSTPFTLRLASNLRMNGTPPSSLPLQHPEITRDIPSKVVRH